MASRQLNSKAPQVHGLQASEKFAFDTPELPSRFTAFVVLDKHSGEILHRWSACGVEIDYTGIEGLDKKIAFGARVQNVDYDGVGLYLAMCFQYDDAVLPTNEPDNLGQAYYSWSRTEHTGDPYDVGLERYIRPALGGIGRYRPRKRYPIQGYVHREAEYNQSATIKNNVWLVTFDKNFAPDVDREIYYDGNSELFERDIANNTVCYNGHYYFSAVRFYEGGMPGLVKCTPDHANVDYIPGPWFDSYHRPTRPQKNGTIVMWRDAYGLAISTCYLFDLETEEWTDRIFISPDPTALVDGKRPGLYQGSIGGVYRNAAGEIYAFGVGSLVDDIGHEPIELGVPLLWSANKGTNFCARLTHLDYRKMLPPAKYNIFERDGVVYMPDGHMYSAETGAYINELFTQYSYCAADDDGNFYLSADVMTEGADKSLNGMVGKFDGSVYRWETFTGIDMRKTPAQDCWGDSQSSVSFRAPLIKVIGDKVLVAGRAITYSDDDWTALRTYEDTMNIGITPPEEEE
jgi:hypothetical protein